MSLFQVVLLAGEHDQMVLFKMVYLQMVLFAECDSPKWFSLVGEPVNNSVCWVSSVHLDRFYFSGLSRSNWFCFEDKPVPNDFVCRVRLSPMVVFAG
jgi:hypothetical protein